MTSTDRDDRDRGFAAAVPEPGVPAQPDPGTPDLPEPAGGRSYGWPPLLPWIAAVLGVLIVPLALAVGITASASASGDWAARAASARVVSAADLEQEFGVKVNLVAVTAAGGLVDMRVQVLDKDKAQRLFHDPTSLPSLFVETRGAVLRLAHGMGHKIVLLDGATYFFLYPNSGGVVQAGTRVSVVVDDLRLEPITAQS